MATIVTLVALAAYCHWHGRDLITVAQAVVLVALMGLSLVRGNQNFLSDTIAGGLVGSGTVLGIAWIVSVAVKAASQTGEALRSPRMGEESRPRRRLARRGSLKAIVALPVERNSGQPSRLAVAEAAVVLAKVSAARSDRVGDVGNSPTAILVGSAFT